MHYNLLKSARYFFFIFFLRCFKQVNCLNRCKRIVNVWFLLRWPSAVDGTLNSKNELSNRFYYVYTFQLGIHNYIYIYNNTEIQLSRTAKRVYTPHHVPSSPTCSTQSHWEQGWSMRLRKTYARHTTLETLADLLWRLSPLFKQLADYNAGQCLDRLRCCPSRIMYCGERYAGQTSNF